MAYHKEIKGNELYVYMNGNLIYKRWLDTGESKVFDIMAYDKYTLMSINEIDFNYRTQQQIDQLEFAFELISSSLEFEKKEILRADFDNFIKRGRLIILNTFLGGIIFLREPELIQCIKIEFNEKSNLYLASVEYASEIRNAQNVKYKPSAGKVEKTECNIEAIFPNFSKHSVETKKLLLKIIGKIVKKICEDENENGWCMKYTAPFVLSLYLDVELDESIEIHYFKTYN